MKDRTVCESCYNKKRRKNNNHSFIQNQQPKIENNNNNKNNVKNPKVSTHENPRHLVFDPSNVGKTYYMLKNLENIGNQRTIHIITRSPKQYPNYKTSHEVKPMNKYKGSVVIFDAMLGARNCSERHEFITRGRHENLDVY